LVTRNVAVVARAPKQRSLQRTEGTSLTEDELRQLTLEPTRNYQPQPKT
jgi:hypothetical protein